jgi:hypothetical protein
VSHSGKCGNKGEKYKCDNDDVWLTMMARAMARVRENLTRKRQSGSRGQGDDEGKGGSCCMGYKKGKEKGGSCKGERRARKVLLRVTMMMGWQGIIEHY